METSLPARMVAEVEGLGRALVAWADAHPDASLAEHEAGVLTTVRAALPRLLGLVVARGTAGLGERPAARVPRCPGCAGRTPIQSWRPRTVRTTCGDLRLTRPWHACRACGHGFSPVDTTLGIAAYHRVSDALHDHLIRLGASTAFRDAAALLADLTGVTVAAETVRDHTEAEGAAWEAAQQCAIAAVAATGESPVPDPVSGQLVVETDGVMVRFLDGWHEVKLGVVGGQEDGALRSPSYVAARETPAAFGPRLLAEAARRGALDVVGWDGPVTGRGLARLRPVVVLGDGAAWIWNLAADHFGDATEIIDYYHATEHLWRAAKAAFGEGTPAAAAWAHTEATALLASGPARVRAALAALAPSTADARAVIRRERGYFATHAHRMDYPAFRAAGLPIGSGAVESAAKHRAQLRLKRPGCRWSEAGAHAVLTVRCALASQHAA